MRKISRSVFEENGKFYPQVYLKLCYLEYYYANDYANGHADNSYVCCKTPLKFMNNSEYGMFLPKKCS